MRIYNYNNEIAVVDLEKIPCQIHVIIVSGDEIVTVVFEDGSSDTYDSAALVGNPRIMSFYDESYSVGKEDIPKWLNWRPIGDEAASYRRARIFGGM